MYESFFFNDQGNGFVADCILLPSSVEFTKNVMRCVEFPSFSTFVVIHSFESSLNLSGKLFLFQKKKKFNQCIEEISTAETARFSGSLNQNSRQL